MYDIFTFGMLVGPAAQTQQNRFPSVSKVSSLYITKVYEYKILPTSFPFPLYPFQP